MADAPQPSTRLAALRPSPIRLLSEGAPLGAMPLGLGEPTWELPGEARRALAALSEGPSSYGPNVGLPELRQVLARREGVPPDDILVTVGSEEALLSLFLAYVEPGTPVLVPDPGYPAYGALARLAGGEPVPYGLGPDWSLDPEAFQRVLAAHPGARLAVVNGPANPTGAAPSREALGRVADLCEAAGVLLVSDEVYRELHAGLRPVGLREVRRSGVVVSSVSKAWGAAGLRVGWMVGDPAVLAPARLVHGFAVTCAAAPMQHAALALLEASDTVLPAARAEVRLRWEALADSLQAHLGLTVGPQPAGGFYHWMALPEGEPDAMAFCLRARDEAGVVLVPGHTFGEAGRGHLRLSFAARPEQIREGVRRLAQVWGR